MYLLKIPSFFVFLLLTPVNSFTINSRERVLSNVASSSTKYGNMIHSRQAPLYSTEPNSENQETSVDIPVNETPVSATTTTSEPEGTQYPLDVPSPILLALSMSLGIVGTGSAFELVNPDPKFGFLITATLAAATIPLCLFLFYASILKATAETEADDKEFMKGRY